MILSGMLSEIYFNENKNAILVLECENKNIAQQLLNQLTLVKNEIIVFDLHQIEAATVAGKTSLE